MSFSWIEGRTPPAMYCRWSLALMLSQYLAAFLSLKALGGSLSLEQTLVHVFVVPLRYLGQTIQGRLFAPTSWFVAAAFLFQVVTAWALAALAIRRARDAAINEWWAAAAILPPLQPLLVLVLRMVFMEVLRGLEADVAGLASSKTQRARNKFEEVTGS